MTEQDPVATSTTAALAARWQHLSTRHRALVAGGAVVVAALGVWGVAQGVAGSPADARPSSSSTVSTSAPEAPSTSVNATASTSPDPASSASAPAVTPEPSVPVAPPAPSLQAAVGDDVVVVDGVAVAVRGLEAIDGDGTGPGEIDGPAVRFAVEVVNRTSAEIPLIGTVVNAYFGSAYTPGVQLSGSGSAPLPVAVGAGATVTGTYVFLLPEDSGTTRVEVFSVPGAAVLLVDGPTPTR